VGERKTHRDFWWGKLKEKHHFEDLGVGGRIFTRMLKECDEAA
jgi:hypothetical protein